MEEQSTTTPQPEEIDREHTNPRLWPENAGRDRTSIIKRPRLKYGKKGRPKGIFSRMTDAEKSRAYEQRVAVMNAKVQQKQDGIGLLAQSIAQFPGGMKEFLPYIKMVHLIDPALEPLIKSFFDLPPSQQSAYKLERMCKDLELKPTHVLAMCVEVAGDFYKNVTKMLSSMAMPDVMKRNITEALKSKGVEDRRMFMQSTGLLPVPKGSTINVQANAQSSSMTTDGQPSGLPSFEDSTNTFSEIIRNAVETRKSLPEPVDVNPEE